MILRKATANPTSVKGTKRITTKFAFIPTKMRKNRDDESGELIWLERYVETRVHDGTNYKPWLMKYSRQRLKQTVLDILEK